MCHTQEADLRQKFPHRSSLVAPPAKAGGHDRPKAVKETRLLRRQLPTLHQRSFHPARSDVGNRRTLQLLLKTASTEPSASRVLVVGGCDRWCRARRPTDNDGRLTGRARRGAAGAVGGLTRRSVSHHGRTAAAGNELSLDQRLLLLTAAVAAAPAAVSGSSSSSSSRWRGRSPCPALPLTALPHALPGRMTTPAARQ